MSPLVLIASFLLIASHHVPAATGYKIICRRLSDLFTHRCNLTNATQYDLNRFHVAGIPWGALLKIVNPEFEKFDKVGFSAIQNARNVTFFEGMVKSIKFQSSSLVSLKVVDSWIENFDVAEEDNFSLKTLGIRSDKYRTISATLRYLKSLEELTLQKCNIRFIVLDQFAEMKNLRLLDLSWNKILAILNEPYLPLLALEYLDVSHNQLKDLKLFPDAYPSLKAVSLKQNPWECDWISSTRGKIGTARITVMGVESRCAGPWSEKLTNNEGLCCYKWFPQSHNRPVNGNDHENLGAVQAPEMNITQPTIVLLDKKYNKDNSLGLAYNTD